MSYNDEEYKIILSISTKCEEFIEEDYIRKGYQTIIKKKKTIKHI